MVDHKRLHDVQYKYCYSHELIAVVQIFDCSDKRQVKWENNLFLLNGVQSNKTILLTKIDIGH